VKNDIGILMELPSMCEARDLIFSTGRKERRKGGRQGVRKERKINKGNYFFKNW
jgi:hypothetical protein